MRHLKVIYMTAAAAAISMALAGCSSGAGSTASKVPLFELHDGTVAADTQGADIEVLNLNNPRQFSYSKSDTDMIFKYKDGTWLDGMDDSIPIDQERFQSMADNFLHLKAVEEIEEPDSLSTYGLKTPQYSVFLNDADEGDVEISIGNQNDDGDYYASVDDMDFYVIKAETVDTLIFSYTSLVVRDSLNVNVTAADVKKASVTANGKTTTFKSSDSQAMTRIANGLTQLKPVRFSSFNASSQDLAYAELDEANRTVFTAEIVNDGETQSVTVYIGGHADAEEIWTYIQLDGSKMISMVESTIISELLNAE